MDKLKAFFQNLNTFQWLALIAFIFGTISVTNATLSLKSRLLAWLPIRTQKKFQKQFEDLKKQLTKAEDARRNFRRVFVRVLWNLLILASMIAAALLLFIAAVVIDKIPLPGFVLFEFLYLIIGMLLLGWALHATKDLPQTIRNIANPLSLGKNLLQLVYFGRAKGFITGHEDFILSLINNKILDDDEKVQLFSLSFDLDRKSVNEHGTKPVHRDNGA